VPDQVRRSKYELVSFESPPVVEVVLTLQFGADSVDLEVLGLFAHEVRAEFPVRQQQPMLSPMAETFDITAMVPPIEIMFEPATALPRTWFLSEDGRSIVQLQHDRISLNWRERQPDDVYPRYEDLQERFVRLLTLLGDLVKTLEREIRFNLAEVTYVNAIEHPAGDGGHHADLANIINRVRSRPSDAFLPDSEDAQLNARWRIPGSELDRESPAGRLYLSAAPGFKPPHNVPTYMVNMTSRVLPGTDDLDGAVAALDVGHKWVVLGFKDLTTHEMHVRWGLKETSA
jgi:uncharacterized protein (TIGR04255 family)